MQIHIPEGSQDQREDDLAAIQQNWGLTPTETYLAVPDGLRPYFLPSAWPPQLVEALRRLSELTVDQKERAHTLLETYFRARIRTGLDKGQQTSIYAALEVVDVEDAIRSLECMIRGQALEGYNRPSSTPSTPSTTTATLDLFGSPVTKRKFSIRDEQAEEPESRPAQIRRLSQDTSFEEEPTSAASQPSVHNHNDTSEAEWPAWLSDHPIATEEELRMLARDSIKPEPLHLGLSPGSAPPPYSPPTQTSISKPSWIPLLQTSRPSASAPALHSPSRFPPRSPISALLTTPKSPVHSPARLPPVSALIQETQWPRECPSHWNAHPVTCREAARLDHHELKLQKLLLEEAEAALEVAKQEHVVAAKRAAVARLEIEECSWVPRRPRSSCGRMG